jgi:hypothetical protein
MFNGMTALRTIFCKSAAAETADVPETQGIAVRDPFSLPLRSQETENRSVKSLISFS